jgi:predicted transcriptional regulator
MPPGDVLPMPLSGKNPNRCWHHAGMAMTLRLPAEIEDQLRQAAESEHRSVQQTVLLAIGEYLSARETAEILADPAALRGLAEAIESEQAGDIVYGVEAARALLVYRIDESKHSVVVEGIQHRSTLYRRR